MEQYDGPPLSPINVKSRPRHCNPLPSLSAFFRQAENVNDHHHFVQEVRANPHDDMPRLIYADYLDEAGDPRGEFIRIQVELSQLPVGEPARIELDERQEELLDAYAEEWLAPLRALGAEGVSRRCFERGLLERVRIQAEKFLETGAELCSISPALHRLELRSAKDFLGTFCDHPLPRQITSLDLSSNRLRGNDLQGFRVAAWTAQIEELLLPINQLNDQALEDLAKAPWPQLRKLNLGSNKIGPLGVVDLAQSQLAKTLEVLVLSLNEVTDLGAQRLAQSPLLERLRELDLSSCKIGESGAEALARSSQLVSLERLVLRGNPLTATAWQAFEDATRLPALRELDVRGSQGGPTRQYGAVPEDPGSGLRARLGDGLLF
jgi:uncharacterized protein (TIGR02996 family)